MPNRLAHETSPYLLQHAENPVDWFPWGEEAFARARAEDRPILLSVGYSACHWCHVMEHESFSDPATAALMNERFVNVKVDREERPDVDALYMEAVVALNQGHGGWPMTVFLQPDGQAFYGGTYYPPEPRHGMPSFRQLLEAISDVYRSEPDRVRGQAEQITGHLRESAERAASAEPLTVDLVDDAIERLEQPGLFDREQGGFGGAPKFPPSSLLPTLLGLAHRPRGEQARAMATLTLDRMADGGIHDQLGGGFHRYAVDGVWLVPHFEKMLYDNALLASAYLAGYQATGRERYRDVTLSTLAYVDRELSLPEGGLASAQDADTEGHEGLTFVWTPADLEAALPDPADRALVAARFGITPHGNFEGATVLSVVAGVEEAAVAAGIDPADAPARLEAARAALLAVRERRPQPARDDKAVAAWNGLALSAFADAGRVLRRPDLVARGRRIAEFLLGRGSAPDGGLWRAWRAGTARVGGFADDHGAVAEGLLALHAATGELRWLQEARRLGARAAERFHDDERGGFFLAPADGEALVARTKDLDDNPAPSGNALLTGALLRLGRVYGDAGWERLGASGLRVARELLPRLPHAFGRTLALLDLYLATPQEIAVVGAAGDERRDALVAEASRRLLPHAVLVVADPADPGFDDVPLLAGKGLVDGAPAAYVCERFACRRPVTTPAELADLL